MNIKVGDKVTVQYKVKDHDPNGMGEGREWENCWVKEMDWSIGKTFTVKKINDYGVYFDGDRHGLGYPAIALKPVETESSPESLLKPFVRVKTKSEGMWIALPVEAAAQGEYESGCVLCKDGGWIRPEPIQGHFEDGYDIVAIYDKPDYFMDALNPKVYGACLWSKELEKTQKEIKDVEDKISELRTNYESQLAELSETLALLNKTVNKGV